MKDEKPKGKELAKGQCPHCRKNVVVNKYKVITQEAVEEVSEEKVKFEKNKQQTLAT